MCVCTTTNPYSTKLIKNGLLALKYKGLHKAESMLKDAMHQWKWPAESEFEMVDADQLQLESQLPIEQFEQNNALDDFDSDSLF